MKIIIGIDVTANYKRALTFIAKALGLNHTINLVHCFDPNFPYAGEVALSPEISQKYAEELEVDGISILKEAEEEARRLGFTDFSSKLIKMPPTSGLIYEASEFNAELIAVGTHHKGSFSAFYSDGITKALTLSSPQNILSVNHDYEYKISPVAVFATDHSFYSNAALSELLEMPLPGVKEFKVLSAYVLAGKLKSAVAHVLGLSNAEPDHWIIEELEKKNSEVVNRLVNAGYKAKSIVVEGNPNTAIADFMKTGDAQFLIIGAQGHGFFNLGNLGSVAVHQVVNGNYPVLVLRPKVEFASANQ